ncbi:hypothetical protein K2Z83_15625 [Oscillochloris sp. ZM17-4]|uniref:SPL family radical SAM protein n=1 Tax=Oscillochloris sp. ZM17-4 TaxID=2866714 RepID=UPI001C738FC6|nr:hypothetical protein [Oscillochloris sp. ZM17-4]MBX0329107.1 hypothetical protein [Oscillochloris sp. ZM17-4]
MQVIEHTAKSILSAQSSGFLVQGPYPFTHTLSPYTGCQFGGTTCGLYCYAQLLPNWRYRPEGLKPTRWGEGIAVKVNAAELLSDYLAGCTAAQRRQLRIFMSTTTDPYMPLEKQRGLTRRLVEVFARYDDLDLLVIQTRSPLVARDFDVLKHIPYAWLSFTIESDDEAQQLRGGPAYTTRFKTVAAAVHAGVRTQVAISPCLPHSPRFADKLVETGAQRFVIDTFTAGDGGGGSRTAQLPYSRLVPAWDEDGPAQLLAQRLAEAGVDVGWSADGFGGIPYRTEDARKGHPDRAHAQGDDMQLRMFTPDPPPEGAMVLTLGQEGAPRRPLPGFPYFWLKYVSGFDARFHCAQCLVGPFHKGIWSTVRVPSAHVLTQAQGWRFAYLCGVAETQWADNLHVPVAHALGQEVEVFTYNGIRVHITNARRVEIPWIDDGWQGFPRSYTTCRNFQFGVHHFGYDGATRPSQPEFTNPKNGRSLDTLQRRQRRRKNQ